MAQPKILIFVFFSTLFINAIGQTMTFDEFNKKLFLSAGLKKLDTSLIDSYKRDNSLRYEMGEIWTSMAEGTERGHFFFFKQNPMLAFPFRQGKIELDTYETDTSYILTNIMMFLEFAKKSEAEKCYKFLIDNYSILSTNKRVMKEDGDESAVFFNSNSGDTKALMISMGRNDESPRGYTIVIGFTDKSTLDDDEGDYLNDFFMDKI